MEAAGSTLGAFLRCQSLAYELESKASGSKDYLDAGSVQHVLRYETLATDLARQIGSFKCRRLILRPHVMVMSWSRQAVALVQHPLPQPAKEECRGLTVTAARDLHRILLLRQLATNSAHGICGQTLWN